MAYNPPIPGPRPPKRKPKSPIAKKLQKPARRPNRVTDSAPSWAPYPSKTQKPRPSSGTSSVPSRRIMPRPARRGQGQMDDMGPFQKPYRRPTGQQMPKPSGRSGSVSSSGPKRKPKKKVSFYGQRPVGRGRFGR